MNAIERLRDYLAARLYALSGHELEQFPELGEARGRGARHGVALLDAVLQEADVSPLQTAKALEVQAPPPGVSRLAVLQGSLQVLRFDALVARLDDALSLDIEPGSRMAP